MIVWESIRGKNCLKHFKCGVQQIDEWASEKAHKRHKNGQSKVTVGYADSSVSGSSFISLSLVSEKSGKLLHADHGSLFPAGAPLIFIEYLAVSRSMQGQGIGTQMLMETFEKAYYVKQLLPIYGVALRSLSDKTTAFYDRIGFKVAPREPALNPLMIMDIWTISDLIESSLQGQA